MEMDQDPNKIIGVSIGTVLTTILIYYLSPVVFVLWIGIVGAAFTWAHQSHRWKARQTSSRSISPPSAEKVKQNGYEEDISAYEIRQGASCPTCDTTDCSRHRKLTTPENSQPWIQLTVRKKVDNSLEEFLGHVLEKFVYAWYRNLNGSEEVVDELRCGLRFLVSKLLLRIKKVDLAEFVTKKIIPAVVTHLIQHVHSHRKVGRFNADRIKLRINRVHRSLYTREDELVYLKQLVISVSPHILPDNVHQCRLLKLLLEEILSGVVLLPVVDKIADPDIVNNLIILFCDEEPPPVNPDPHSDLVELLGHFAAPNTESQPLINHDLGRILNDQILMVSFMGVMKQNGGIRYLQFFLTLDNFKKELLSSAMSEADLSKLHSEASDMYRLFCKPEAHDRVDIGDDLLLQFKQLAEGGTDGIKQLQTEGDFLARAYDYLYNLIDSYYLPIFRHSTQYYTFLYGDKNARPDPSMMGARGDRRSFSLSNKLKGSMRLSNSSKDLKEMDSSNPSTPDKVSLQDEDVLDETLVPELHDLTDWMIEIPSITILHDSHGRPTYSFQVKVYKNNPYTGMIDYPDGIRNKTFVSVYRTYNEFYNLEQKLKQFHGDKMTCQLPHKKISIFSTKDHEYLDGVKPKFEEYLKNVLAMTELKNSELLYNFLTLDDFSKSSASDIRIDRVLKSVPGRLVKERGQNLKSFLKTIQNSITAKAARPDFSKVQSTEAGTSSRKPSLIQRHLMNPLYTRSHIRQPSNGVAVEPNNHLLTVSSTSHSDSNMPKLSSVTECVKKIAEEVFNISKSVHVLFCALTMVATDLIDSLISWYIGTKLDQVLEEHRVEALINLLKDSLFYDESPPRTDQQKLQRKELALKDIKNFIPDILSKLTDRQSFDTSLEELFEVLQHAKLNKQLVFILVDVIFSELFPELLV